MKNPQFQVLAVAFAPAPQRITDLASKLLICKAVVAAIIAF